MFSFTKQERMVLALFILTVLCGSILQYAFKKYPSLKDSVNLLDSENLYPKADINTASFAELVDIPYIGEYTAANIIEHRQEKGPFSSVAEVKNVKGVREKNYQKFRQYLIVNQ